jgi:aminoglycoside 3-N-acetyltransferase
MANFTQSEFAQALRNLGLKEGDTVFSHSNIGFFGYPEGERSVENSCQTILRAFQSVIGESGTLIVPTFTYSFSNNQTFDFENSPSTCGVFTEFIRKHPEASRSCDPAVSVAALGAQAKLLTENAPQNSYDSEKSFFARFCKSHGKVCNLNFDAGSTFVHFVERELKVPYRFDKTFSGKIIQAGQVREAKNTLWVRYLCEGTAAKFEPFDEVARKMNCFKTAKVSRGFVGVISASDTLSVIQKTLPSRPWFLTEAELTGKEPDLKNAKQ